MFDAGWGCNATDEDLVQRELVFRGRGAGLGGHVCVRLASGGRWEVRYSPPGNTGSLYHTSLLLVRFREGGASDCLCYGC